MDGENTVYYGKSLPDHGRNLDLALSAELPDKLGQLFEYSRKSKTPNKPPKLSPEEILNRSLENASKTIQRIKLLNLLKELSKPINDSTLTHLEGGFS